MGQLLEDEGPLDIHDICDRMGISRQIARDVIKAYRRHLTGLVGKAMACARDDETPMRYVYHLTNQWQTDEGPDIQRNEAWFTKRIGEEVVTARDMAIVALENTDGRRRRLRADIGDLVSVLTSVADRVQFMRERLLILEEDLESAS
ncbi:MAG: hypothetical protein LC798_19150 [Chloroflexi bacterium]|nr:hypothetical protein [Chloroflexota bacterium]